MRAILFILITLFFSGIANATETKNIRFFNNKLNNKNVSFEKVTHLIEAHFPVKDYRSVKAQIIYNKQEQPNHILVFLFSKNVHGFKLSRVNIDKQYNVMSITQNYHVTQEDLHQQPGKTIHDVQCPDTSTQFIAFAPNDMELEQQITIDVARAAKFHLLKTVQLLKENATRESYLNYMSCPNLMGNFYDGDANTDLIVTDDGVITATEIKELLANKFRFKVTNIWLACEAFNDPMRSAVIDVAQTQKYAAGINDLLIGPSDKAAACAMKAAMKHKPMKESFEKCYKLLDTPLDHWGFDGNGSNYFGM